MCLKNDPDERSDINTVKKELLDIFKIEVHDKRRYDKMKELQNKNKENKMIKDLFKNNNEDTVKDVIRFNKILVRKEINIDNINIINDKENAKSILTQRLNERNKDNSTHIGNSVHDTLQRINLKKAQKLRINEHIILELKQRLKNINS